MRNFTIFLFIYLIIFLSVPHAQFNYLPSQVDSHQEVDYTQFTLSYNEEHEQADWVAYELNKTEAEITRSRCDCFASDPNISTGSANDNDYSSTGFDRGHLSPAADNNISDIANRESFLFSNMSPQNPNINRVGGLWYDLEDWVRAKAIELDTIYVVTGPVFKNNLGNIGNNEVTIPGYFYKCILRLDGNTAKTIAFLIPNVGASGELRDFIVTINTIETLTGIDFFPALDNTIENRVESQYEPGNWGF